MDDRSRIQKCRARKQDLWSKRSSYDPVWRELAEYISPRSGRWSVSGKDRGDKKHQKIFDSTATGALQVLVSGIISGMSNPNTAWLRYQTPDQDLNKFHSVRVWLDHASDVVLRIFRESNTYAANAHVQHEKALFGTGCTFVAPSMKTVIHHHPLTAGQFALAANDLGEIDTMTREYAMTVVQMVSQFGLDKVSASVRNQYDRCNYDQLITVYHTVEPRALGDRDPSKMDGKNMPWRSVYFEDSKSANDVLSEGGFRTFPVLAPRWRVIGQNVYGESPAMDAINPVKRLQKMTLAEGKSAAFQADPVLQGPPGLKGKRFAPGEILEIENGQEVKPVWQPNTQLNQMDVLLQRVQAEINERFFRSLFTIISDADGAMTAYQVQLMSGERLSQLGPTIMRDTREYYSPLADITFGHAMDQGLIAPPPPELEGMEIKPEMIGPLAQAQKASEAQSSDQLQQKVMAHAEMDPAVRHILDPEYDIRSYADVIGADPRRLRTPEKYQEMVAAEAKAQAAQAQTEAMAQHAGAAKDVAEATAAGA